MVDLPESKRYVGVVEPTGEFEIEGVGKNRVKLEKYRVELRRGGTSHAIYETVLASNDDEAEREALAIVRKRNRWAAEEFDRVQRRRTVKEV